MVKLLIEILFLLGISFASLLGFTVSFDTDLRYNIYEWKENNAEVNLIGLSLRKVFSDSKGDRLNIVLTPEIEDNFKEFMIHQFYVNYKGAMGLWNISLGRRYIPYGLLYSFDQTRLLYYSPHPVLTFDSDDGIMLWGAIDRFDYAVSFTLGHGHPNSLTIDYPKLFAARSGFAIGNTEENNVGISFMYGKMYYSHSEGIKYTDKKAVGFDFTFYWANLIGRVESNAGFIDTSSFGSIAIIADIALTSKIDLTGVFKIMREEGIYKDDMVFLGTSFTHGYLKLRGGYSYAFFKKPSQALSFQLYYLYTFNI